MWILQLASVSAAVITSSALGFTAPGFHRPGRHHGDSPGTPDTAVERTVARDCADVVNGPQRLLVHIQQDRIDETAVAFARAEVEAIWRRYQIEVVWVGKWQSGAPPADLYVQFVDQHTPPNPPDGGPVIAWIPFVNGVPTSLVRVSRPTARALLEKSTWFDGRPMHNAASKLRHVGLGRIIGRALAHEIGHYLLASSMHAANGLMSPVLKTDWLVTPSRARYRLTEREMRALRSARIASCEVHARRR